MKSSAKYLSVSIAIGIYAVAGLVLAGICAAAADNDRAQFVRENHCALAWRLAHILKAGSAAREHSRYVIIAPETRADHYVQCMYYDQNTMLGCEVASGYHTSKDGKPPLWTLAKEKLERLSTVGIDPDGSKGNHSFHRKTRPEDPEVTAELMLTLLDDIFDARRHTRASIVAPLADKARDRPGCTPVS